MVNHSNPKLKWHQFRGLWPRIVDGRLLWLVKYWRKGKIVNARGDHVMSTTIEYSYHSNHQHFEWVLKDGEDKIEDESFWGETPETGVTDYGRNTQLVYVESQGIDHQSHLLRADQEKPNNG
jgi:hypothetical protein